MVSIMTHLIQHSDYQGQINLLYTSRRGVSRNLSSILFIKRILRLFTKDPPQRRYHCTVFCTDRQAPPVEDKRRKSVREREKLLEEPSADKEFLGEHHSIEYRRFEAKDLETALGPVEEREGVVAYVCGPPTMSDWAVGVLDRSEGMDQKRVLCEKWW